MSRAVVWDAQPGACKGGLDARGGSAPPEAAQRVREQLGKDRTVYAEEVEDLAEEPLGVAREAPVQRDKEAEEEGEGRGGAEPAGDELERGGSLRCGRR